MEPFAPGCEFIAPQILGITTVFGNVSQAQVRLTGRWMDEYLSYVLMSLRRDVKPSVANVMYM